MDQRIIIVLGILGIISFITLIILILLKIYSGHKNLLNNIDYFYEDKVIYIGNENIKDSNEGVKYSYSLCFYLVNLGANSVWINDGNTPKTIMFSYGSPNINYLRKDNILQIQLSYRNKEGLEDLYNFNLDNIENQKWINLVITVNNRKVNIYKNGILFTSKIIPNVNLKSYKTLTLGEKNNNFNGYLAYVDYYNYELNSDNILKLYYKNKKKLNKKKLLSYEQYKYLNNS